MKITALHWQQWQKQPSSLGRSFEEGYLFQHLKFCMNTKTIGGINFFLTEIRISITQLCTNPTNATF